MTTLPTFTTTPLTVYEPYDPAYFDEVYALIKRAVEKPVIELMGDWPEPDQTDFFETNLAAGTTHVIRLPAENGRSKGRIVACFGYDESENVVDSVLLSKTYLDWSKLSANDADLIGKKIVETALKHAVELKVPLETSPLVTDKMRLKLMANNRFRVLVEDTGYESDSSLAEEFPDIRMTVMRHRDTEEFAEHKDEPDAPILADGFDMEGPEV